jgi:predicted PurR-regulated permease PerM
MLHNPDGRQDTARDAAEAEADKRRKREWLRVASQIATIGIFILMLGIILSVARGLLRPLVAAIIVTVMLGPVARRMVTRQFPPVLFAILVVSVIVALIHFATIVMSGPVANLVNVLPTLGPTIAQKFAVLDPMIGVWHNLQGWLTPRGGTSAFRVDLAPILQATIVYLTPAVGELIVFLATLFLALVSRDSLRRNLILFFPDQDERLAAIHVLNDIEARLTQYIGTVTAINLSLGVVTALICWAVGLPSPTLFGLLACIANFIPYIGPGFTILALLVAGLVTLPLLTDALIAPAVFLAVATVEGQLITPALVGQRITASPLAVFVSLAFWIWLWGPVGGFLSVPILIVGYAILNQTRPKSMPAIPG